MSSQACWSAGGRNAPAVANSRRPPPSCAWTLRNRRRRARVRAAAGRCRRSPRRTSRSWPCFSTSRSMALQNRSTTWGTSSMVVTRCSRRLSKMTRGLRLRTYRMSAPDVHRVEQRDLLLQAVREREQRDEPVLHRLDDPVEATSTPASELEWASITPLGLPVVPDGEHELVDVVRPRAVPGPDLRLPVAREGLVRLLGQGCRRSWSGTARGRPRAGPGASRPVPSRRRTAPEAAMMFAMASALMRESSGT